MSNLIGKVKLYHSPIIITNQIKYRQQKIKVGETNYRSSKFNIRSYSVHFYLYTEHDMFTRKYNMRLAMLMDCTS